VRTDTPNYRQPENTVPRHDEPELVLLFASSIPVRFGLCARSVLNLHDRIQGSQVAARLTVGYPNTLTCLLFPERLRANRVPYSSQIIVSFNKEDQTLSHGSEQLGSYASFFSLRLFRVGRRSVAARTGVSDCAGFAPN
jgi:hypothetical protein